ncbi:hypothetical protein JOY44_24515 (plasmid) [Phormidium sp. CLA17]|uniref:hypothetical protein n=1 Tax=Leptolyngbya sp. Cla-17 TaxID=2803751 RepID=UPI0014913CE9|nr:hypothetical protein [Leptolyngbya sp. Cla-17]MBM0744725.1 hypothetical protein [Leptolyngbya sp. Cla-17]
MPSVHVTGFSFPLHLRPHRQTEAGKSWHTLEVSQIDGAAVGEWQKCLQFGESGEDCSN